MQVADGFEQDEYGGVHGVIRTDGIEFGKLDVSFATKLAPFRSLQPPQFRSKSVRIPRTLLPLSLRRLVCKNKTFTITIAQFDRSSARGYK